MRRVCVAAAATLALAACGPHPGGRTPADDGPAPAFVDLEAFAEAPVLAKADARVRLDPPHRAITGEATLTVRGVTTREFPVLFDAYVAGTGGFRLDEVSQDGAPCRFAVYGGDTRRGALESARKVVVVRPRVLSKDVTLRLRWSGSPSPAAGQGFLLPDEALLLDVDGWLPFLPATDAAWTLDATWPEGFETILEGAPAARAAKEKGFLEAKSSFRSYAATTLFARPKYATKRIDVEGQAVLLAVPPANAVGLPVVEKSVRAALAALKPLGPLPGGLLRVVESTMTSNLPGAQLEAFGGRSFVAFRPDEPEVSLLAHEISHSFFGGTMFPKEVAGDLFGRKAARTELWPESLAEYASAWSFDEAGFRERRMEWERAYAGGSGEGIFLGRTAASYTRAPMLLAGIEHRVGRAKMEAALAGLVRDNRGKRIGWDAIIASVAASAGKEEGEGLRAWINRPGAPDLKLENLSLADGKLAAVLTQQADPPYAGRLELAFVAAPLEQALETPMPPISSTTVEFHDSRTEISLVVPAGAQTLLIDPDFFVPRVIAVDPMTPGVLAVALDRPLPRPKSTWFLRPP